MRKEGLGKKIRTFLFLAFLAVAGFWLFAVFAVVSLVGKFLGEEDEEEETCSEKV